MDKLIKWINESLLNGTMDQITATKIRGSLSDIQDLHSVMYDEVHRVSWGLLAQQELMSRYQQGLISSEQYIEKVNLIYKNLSMHPLFKEAMPQMKESLLSQDVDLSRVEDVTEHLPTIAPSLYK